MGLSSARTVEGTGFPNEKCIPEKTSMGLTNHGHGLEEDFPVGVSVGCNSINSFKDPRVKRWSKVGLVQHLVLTPKPRHNNYVFVFDFKSIYHV